jgi:hypothetical protein
LEPADVTIVSITYDEKQAAAANATYPLVPGGAEYTDLLDPSVSSWATVDSPGIVSERFTLAAGANNAAYGILGPNDGRPYTWSYYYYGAGDGDAYQLGVLPRGVYTISVSINAWTLEGLGASQMHLGWLLTKDSIHQYSGYEYSYGNSGSYDKFTFEVSDVTSTYQLYVSGSGASTGSGLPYKAMLLREGDVGSVSVTPIAEAVNKFV